MARLLLYDIDGFVADSSVRIRKHIDCLPDDPVRFYECIREYSKSTEGDVPIWPGIHWVRAMRMCLGVDRCVALTSRDEGAREPTYHWLNLHMGFHVHHEDMLMRPLGLKASALTPVELKAGRVQWLLSQGHEIVMAADDHVEVCKMYLGFGIPTFLGLFPGVDCLSHIGDPRV